MAVTFRRRKSCNNLKESHLKILQRLARKSFTSDSLAVGALGNLNGFRVDRSRLRI